MLIDACNNRIAKINFGQRTVYREITDVSCDRNSSATMKNIKDREKYFIKKFVARSGYLTTVLKSLGKDRIKIFKRYVFVVIVITRC